MHHHIQMEEPTETCPCAHYQTFQRWHLLWNWFSSVLVLFPWFQFRHSDADDSHLNTWHGALRLKKHPRWHSKQGFEYEWEIFLPYTNMSPCTSALTLSSLKFHSWRALCFKQFFQTLNFCLKRGVWRLLSVPSLSLAQLPCFRPKNPLRFALILS